MVLVIRVEAQIGVGSALRLRVIYFRYVGALLGCGIITTV